MNADFTSKQARNFCNYLHFFTEIASSTTSTTRQSKFARVRSGAVESAVKQIDRRSKISGAQWNKENLPQVLAHRSAYLNGKLNV